MTNADKAAKMQAQAAEPLPKWECTDADAPTSLEVMAKAAAAGKEHGWVDGKMWTFRRTVQAIGFPPAVTQEPIWAYDRDGRARKVRLAAAVLARGGLWPACPLCVGYHTESENDLNACPERAPLPTTTCQECGYVVYDNATPAGDALRSPADRLADRLQEHVEAYHPRTARRLYPVPAPGDLVCLRCNGLDLREDA